MDESTPKANETTVTAKRGIPAWMWAAGVAVLAVIGWQVAQGVFVKSIDAPGGASISFYPPAPAPADTAAAQAQAQAQASAQAQQIRDEIAREMASKGLNDPRQANSANVIEQSNGTGNKASIHGDHNQVQQSGSGNSAVIGGE